MTNEEGELQSSPLNMPQSSDASLEGIGYES
jgi:hypothetical protein